MREIIAGEIRRLFVASHRRKRRIIANAKLRAVAFSLLGMQRATAAAAVSTEPMSFVDRRTAITRLVVR